VESSGDGDVFPLCGAAKCFVGEVVIINLYACMLVIDRASCHKGMNARDLQRDKQMLR